jgi:hypothetical protein
MADISKNARGTTNAQKFMCPCGGEVKMKSIFTNGKLRLVAECQKCNRKERKPSNFCR